MNESSSSANIVFPEHFPWAAKTEVARKNTYTKRQAGTCKKLSNHVKRGWVITEMTKLLLFSKVLAAVIAPALVQGVKIAFVGDTGMDGT